MHVAFIPDRSHPKIHKAVSDEFVAQVRVEREPGDHGVRGGRISAMTIWDRATGEDVFFHKDGRTRDDLNELGREFLDQVLAHFNQELEAVHA